MTNAVHVQSGNPEVSKTPGTLESRFLEQIVSEEPWKIALSLNRLDSDVGSRYAISDRFDKHSSELKATLGENRFKELAGVVAYANSMLLDFESALPYALIENNKDSLVQLQENAILYARSSVVSKLDDLGRKNNIPELLIGKKDMQDFLVYHALAQIRLCCSTEKQYTYTIEQSRLDDILDKIDMPRNQAIRSALDVLEAKNNQNVVRKLLFAKALGDKTLIDKYQAECTERYSTPRWSVDSYVKERAIFLGEGEVSRLQFGDENPVFPVASNIFLVDDKARPDSKKVWKEDLKLYVDFSRLDGYSQEKEILSGLDYPNIIKLLGAFNEKNMNFLELEYAQGKPLDKYPAFSETETQCIAITLCDILDYLHSNNIVYMDIKKKNVMYNRPETSAATDITKTYSALEQITNNLKLLDFGMSQKTMHLDDSSTLTTLLSTPEYLSPELTGFRSNIATDTFQLGLMLHNMLYNTHAFIDSNLDSRLRFKEGDEFRESEVLMYGLAVKYGKYSAPDDRYGPLLSRMLDKDPSKRPDLSYVKDELMKIYDSKMDAVITSTADIQTDAEARVKP